MKKRLGLIAVVCLLGGLTAGGFAAWSYRSAQAGEKAGRELQKQSYDLEYRSDIVKGTPEEKKLVEEGVKKQQEAEEAFDKAKRSSRLAVISGIASIVLILASVAMIVLNLRKREANPS